MGISPIGGFMPIPLAMMIPFMAVQSMVMGDAFGRAYQYGKRKISSMTNEEFNAYTKPQMAQEIFTDYKQIIPALGVSIQDSTKLQQLIVDEMLQIIPKVIGGLATDVAKTIPEILEEAEGTGSRKGGGGGNQPTAPSTPPSQREKQTMEQTDEADIKAMYQQAIRYAEQEKQFDSNRKQVLERRELVRIGKITQAESNQLMQQAINWQNQQITAKKNKENVTQRIGQLQIKFKAKYGRYVALAPIGTPA